MQSGRYLEVVNADTSNWLQGGSINQNGEIHAVNSFEASSCGTGACAVTDGLNHAAAIWNPEGDIEIWEMAEPLLYLGRNVKANSGGYGKYRGGCGFETLRMVWNAQDSTMFLMGNGFMNSDWGNRSLGFSSIKMEGLLLSKDWGNTRFHS